MKISGAVREVNTLVYSFWFEYKSFSMFLVSFQLYCICVRKWMSHLYVNYKRLFFIISLMTHIIARFPSLPVEFFKLTTGDTYRYEYRCLSVSLNSGYWEKSRKFFRIHLYILDAQVAQVAIPLLKFSFKISFNVPYTPYNIEYQYPIRIKLSSKILWAWAVFIPVRRRKNS